MYAITGASGQLGRLVIDALLETVPANRIIAAVRNPAKARDLEARGVVVREADYKRPETLATAFLGVDKLLLISSTEIAGCLPLHRPVIDAARRVEVSFIPSTSMPHTDPSLRPVSREVQPTDAAHGSAGRHPHPHRRPGQQHRRRPRRCLRRPLRP